MARPAWRRVLKSLEHWPITFPSKAGLARSPPMIGLTFDDFESNRIVRRFLSLPCDAFDSMHEVATPGVVESLFPRESQRRFSLTLRSIEQHSAFRRGMKRVFSE